MFGYDRETGFGLSILGGRAALLDPLASGRVEGDWGAVGEFETDGLGLEFLFFLAPVHWVL